MDTRSSRGQGAAIRGLLRRAGRFFGRSRKRGGSLLCPRSILIKYLVQHAGLAAITQLYEEHFDGTRPISDDVQRITGKGLVRWRTEWLEAIGVSR